jgi:hypothetical protein
MDEETVSSASPEDPVVVLGSGILGWTGDERRTDRYGTVHLTVMDSIPGELAPARTVPVPPDDDLAVRILQELAKGNSGLADDAAAASEAAARRPDIRVVAFDHAPLGTAGTLVAHVIHAEVSDDDREFGRRHPESRPPVPGERVVLGSGALFTEEYADWPPLIGVRPSDGRQSEWMDPDALFRCKGHLVRLEFEISKGGAPGAAAARPVQAARQDGDLPQSAGRIAQVGFPVANPLAQDEQAAAKPASARAGTEPGTEMSTTTTDPKGWTIAFRNPRANRFTRVAGLDLTWHQATALADVYGHLHPDQQVYYVSSAKAEAEGRVVEEDRDNILVETGRRVKVADREVPGIAELTETAALPEGITVGDKIRIPGRGLSLTVTEAVFYPDANLVYAAEVHPIGSGANSVLQVLLTPAEYAAAVAGAAAVTGVTQGAADISQKAIGARGHPLRLSADFPDHRAKGTSGRPAAARRTTGQPGRRAPRRTP